MNKHLTVSEMAIAGWFIGDWHEWLDKPTWSMREAAYLLRGIPPLPPLSYERFPGIPDYMPGDSRPEWLPTQAAGWESRCLYGENPDNPEDTAQVAYGTLDWPYAWLRFQEAHDQLCRAAIGGPDADGSYPAIYGNWIGPIPKLLHAALRLRGWLGPDGKPALTTPRSDTVPEKHIDEPQRWLTRKECIEILAGGDAILDPETAGKAITAADAPIKRLSKPVRIATNKAAA